MGYGVALELSVSALTSFPLSQRCVRMKKFLMVALVASAVMAAQAPDANAGPLRNLIARVTNRPKPVPPSPVVPPAPKATYNGNNLGTVVASCAGCQNNSSTSGIIWASGGTCANGNCSH